LFNQMFNNSLNSAPVQVSYTPLATTAGLALDDHDSDDLDLDPFACAGVDV